MIDIFALAVIILVCTVVLLIFLNCLDDEECYCCGCIPCRLPWFCRGSAEDQMHRLWQKEAKAWLEKNYHHILITLPEPVQFSCSDPHRHPLFLLEAQNVLDKYCRGTTISLENNYLFVKLTPQASAPPPDYNAFSKA